MTRPPTRSGTRRLRQVLRLARQLLPRDGDLDGLLRNLGKHRDRPVVVLERDLGQDGPSGLWIDTAGTDYVVIDTAGLPSRRAAVICHEVAHMLLGHRGQAGDLSEIVATVRPTLAARFLTRHGYDEPDELDAEQLATQLVTEHARRVRASRLNEDPISARLR